MSTPEPQPQEDPMARRAMRVLWIGMLIQAVGLIILTWRRRTAIETVLFLELDLPEVAALWIDRLGAAAVLGCTLYLIKQKGKAPKAAFFLCAWFFFLMMCYFVRGAVYLQELTIPAWGMRLMLPFVLAWFAVAGPKAWPGFHGFARLACASSFLAHGLEAWKLHPRFIDLLIAFFADRLGFTSFDQSAAESMLFWIAVHDIILALLILVPWSKLRAVALWMALWGGVTALSRMVQWGWGGADITLIRIAHFVLPLALFFCWSKWRTPQANKAHSDLI